MLNAVNSCEDWEGVFSRYFSNREQKMAKDLGALSAMDILAKDKSGKILELFCGRGECQQLLVNRGYTAAFGADISEELVRQADQASRIQICDSLNICYKPDTFDCVFINEGLHHLKDAGQIRRCFEEVKMVLKNGGTFAFYEPAQTLARRIATLLVLSPMSHLSKRARLLRSILIQEKREFEFWLRNLPVVLKMLGDLDFRIERKKTTPIHLAVVCRVYK